MSHAEEMTVAIIAGLFFRGIFETTRCFLHEQGYVPRVLSKSRFNRRLLPLRKSNSKRPVKPWVHYLQASYQKVIETTGCMIEKLLPKSIHAVIARGFELKVTIFVLAWSIFYLF
jgi:hypothetical protein